MGISWNYQKKEPMFFIGSFLVIFHSYLHDLVSFSLLTQSMMVAGTPATTANGGTSFVTTAPAAMIAPSSMVTPGKTIAPKPIQTCLPIRIGCQ